MNVTFNHHEGVLKSTTVGLKGQEVLRQPPFMAMGQARHLPLYWAFHIRQQQKLSLFHLTFMPLLSSRNEVLAAIILMTKRLTVL